MIRGGRLWHLVGGNDKGRAVRWLQEAYEAACGRRLPALASGQRKRPADAPQRARSILVERPGLGHLKGTHPDIEEVPGVGPVGWARGVLCWLRELSVGVAVRLSRSGRAAHLDRIRGAALEARLSAC